MKLSKPAVLVSQLLCVLSMFAIPAAEAATSSHSLLARGRYLVVVGGCNDCHTAGYADSGGTVPEKHWLEGSALGWHGPWGTTYPPNLRRFMRTLSQKQWIQFARTRKLRPPMPYWALRVMSEQDLIAIYTFVKHLGPAGKAAPTYLTPDRQPKAPYVKWVLPVQAAK